jgi:hypothetical protein
MGSYGVLIFMQCVSLGKDVNILLSLIRVCASFLYGHCML